MTKLIKGGRRMSKLVLKTGRAKGQSPLNPTVSALVHEAALWFWTRRNGRVADAYSLLVQWIKAANAEMWTKNPAALPHSIPSQETLRKRIARLRCYDTVMAKHGERAARKLLRGSGEPMIVDTLLQVVLMDATTLEQVIVFDEDWKLPACKIRIVALMDARSRAIVGWHIYAGPNRTETSLEAVINAMTPPDVPNEELATCPQLAWIFGKPLGILPDNELALVGPSVLPGFEELTITLLEPSIEMPTAKASLERFWGTLKGMLAQAPGTIIDPKIAKDMDYDAVGAATLTLSQLRHLVAQVVAWHNAASSRGLDGQSPVQVWTRLAAKRATPAFTDIAHARRVLGRTEEGLLTTDGYERLGIRYRSEVVDSLLDNMSNTSAVRSQRKDGSWTVRVKVRISPGNLEGVQIFDTLLDEWVDVPSTQPEYTHLLSEWEHREFTKQAKLRNEAFNSQEQRLASRARTIAKIDQMAPKMKFQQRRDMATLSQSLQVKRLGGPNSPTITAPDGMVVASQASFEKGRRDEVCQSGRLPSPRSRTRDRRHPIELTTTPLHRAMAMSIGTRSSSRQHIRLERIRRSRSTTSSQRRRLKYSTMIFLSFPLEPRRAISMAKQSNRDTWLVPQTGHAVPQEDDAAIDRSSLALERQAAIFVPHGPQGSIMTRMEVLRRRTIGKRGKPLPGLRLSQVPQAGKSKTLEEYIRQLHERCRLAGLPYNPFRVLYIGLEVSTTIKMLCKRLLKMLGDPHSEVGNKDDLRIRMHEFMLERRVELLIVDEVQHLSRESNDRMDVTDELKRLLDNGTVPLVLVGDEKSKPFFERNTALAGRLGSPLELSPLRPKGEQARLFKMFCHNLDTAMVDAAVFTEAANLTQSRMLSGLIAASGGHVGRVCRIIEAAVEHAALRGASRIEPCDISSAVNTFAIPSDWVAKNPFELRAS